MIIGLVGKPNCGKSTFFKACTLAEVDIANYPFTTIDKNEGVGFVKVDCIDKEFNIKCNPRFGYCLDNKRFIPVKLIDVAGLIPGSYKGLGKGNKFLNDLSNADVLIHVIDISGSTNEKGELVEKFSYDPAEDIKFLEKEIDMWYYQILHRELEIFKRKSKSEEFNIKKVVSKKFSGLKITEEHIEDVLKEIGKDFRAWNDKDIMKFSSLLRKKSKPIIIAANKIDIPGSEKNLARIKKEFKDYIIIGCSAESELALKEAAKNKLIEYIPGEESFEITGKVNDKQKKGLDFIKKFLVKHKNTGVQGTLNKAVFDLLKYIIVYPVENSKLEDSKGNKLPDCFLMEKVSNALDLAFRIHTDIGEKFVKARNLKTKKIISKDYILKDNDVIEIITK